MISGGAPSRHPVVSRSSLEGNSFASRGPTLSESLSAGPAATDPVTFRVALYTSGIAGRQTGGQMVNRPYGDKSQQLLERHDASDFELRTQDILDPDPKEDESGQ